MSAPGMYKDSYQGYTTFLPDPLPPALGALTRLNQRIEIATHLLGQVEMCRSLLPNVDLLIYSSLRREAIASSTIEGTIASADELILFEATDFSDREAVHEVSNYRIALEWGCQQLETKPIGLNLILGLHERLLYNVRGATGAGRLKEQQSYIGKDRHDPISAAIFVPPAPADTLALLTDLERYMNLPAEEPRIVQCALAHYQFETIHPFSDGNGRVGRLLIILHLIQLGLLSAPMIYPSVYFERNRDQYYQSLRGVHWHGNWEDWLSFFVRGIEEQCRETIAFTQMIGLLKQHLHEEIGNVRRRSSLNAVLDVFFQQPVVSISEIARMANMAYNSVQTAIGEFQRMGVVYEITGKQKGREYACRPVLDAIFGRLPVSGVTAPRE